MSEDKNFKSAFEKTRKVWQDVETLDRGGSTHGALAVAMSNLMLAQSINFLRMDFLKAFKEFEQMYGEDCDE